LIRTEACLEDIPEGSFLGRAFDGTILRERGRERWVKVRVEAVERE